MSKKNENRAPKQSFAMINRNYWRMFFKVVRLSPTFAIGGFLVEGVLWGINRVVDMYFTLHLFNAIDDGKPLSELLRIILYVAIWQICFQIVDKIYFQIMRPILHYRLNYNIHKELFEKAKTLDISCYDDPEFYNDFVWSMEESSERAIRVIENINKMARAAVAFFAAIAALATADTDAVVIVVLCAMGVISCIVNHVGNKVNYMARKERTPLYRKQSYINRAYHLPDYAKEIRLSRADELLVREADENNDELVRVGQKYGKKYFLLYGLFNNVLMEATSLGITFYMFICLLRGSIQLGTFAASVGIVWQVRHSISEFVERLAKFPEHSLFLEKYYGFLKYEPKVVSGEREVGFLRSLELKNVSFSYDFSANPKYRWHKADHVARTVEGSKDALTGVNLKIEKGEKIAIVGYNGAGKTTLIKLLMRLYDPTGGTVFYNGRPLTEYRLDEYRDKIGCVFQDFKLFDASIAENVMGGDYDAERDGERVREALCAAGFSDKLSTLSAGIDTHLGCEFSEGGINLSSGEGQKVAIARVFARPYELWIMDEPSSALDPVAEYELNQSILEHAKDKTVIFISHRLSTTRMADRIYMFDSGRLIEAGSHDELMRADGKYAEMFNLQAEKYK